MTKLENVVKQIAEIKSTIEDNGYNKNLGSRLQELQEELTLLRGTQYGTLAYVESCRDELLSRSSDVKQNLDNMINAKLSEVSYWKYANSDYFNPIPYYNEINSFKKGQVLKNVAESERFKKRFVYSFGFNSSDQLVITQHSNDSNGEDYNKFGVATKMYTTNPDGSIDYYTATWYPTNEQPNRLNGTVVYKPLSDKSWIDVGVGDRSWATNHYIYNESDRLERVVKGGTWGGRVLFEFYDFIYGQDGDLEKIISDYQTIWKSKTKKS